MQRRIGACGFGTPKEGASLSEAEASKLDTHFGDLNEKQDGTTLGPETWLSLSDDSHHREGVLVFSRSLLRGELELTLPIQDEDVGFVWETPAVE